MRQAIVPNGDLGSFKMAAKSRIADHLRTAVLKWIYPKSSGRSFSRFLGLEECRRVKSFLFEQRVAVKSHLIGFKHDEGVLQFCGVLFGEPNYRAWEGLNAHLSEAVSISHRQNPHG